MIRQMIPTHFTVNYIHKEYHLSPEDIKHSAPRYLGDKIFRIYNSENILGLVLAFYVSLGISSRKTAFILQQVFKIPITYQTVLNYAKMAAYYCHRFNLQHKGPIDDVSAGDETYIKIKGKMHYVWLVISTQNRVITAYHLANNRGPIPAIAALKEAVRTAKTKQHITCVTDGNPSYPAAIIYLNKNRENKITHKKVIGLQNLDQESTEFREFKQIIERLNRTYKSHVRPAAGFSAFNGAMALTTLFVTHYNFLRPHGSLGYKSPIQRPDLDNIDTIQSKWIHILKMAL